MKHDLSTAFSLQMKTLLAPLSPSSTRLIVALSGGLDSIVLLHLLSQFQLHHPNFTLLAHNVNHGLSPNADKWGQFCNAFCASLGVTLISSKVSLEKKSRSSLEAIARDARYQCFKQKMQPGDTFLTGHHQDDQLETLLLALKRGSGSTGLQGIRASQVFEQGFLLRPLLIFSRQELHDYALRHQLQWIEDESNQNIDFDRNFIRQEISPLLKQRWPTMAKSVSRTAQLCQEQQSLLDEVAQQDLTMCTEEHFNCRTVVIAKLEMLSCARRNNAIRYWLKSHDLQYPSSKQLWVLWHEVALAQVDKQPVLILESVSIRRYQGRLYVVFPSPALLPEQPIAWTGESVLWLHEQLGVNFSKVDPALSEQYAVRCCSRKHFAANVTCLPEGREKRRSIKKLLHEYQVPPWLRDHVIFITVDGELLTALGAWRCAIKWLPHFEVSEAVKNNEKAR